MMILVLAALEDFQNAFSRLEMLGGDRALKVACLNVFSLSALAMVVKKFCRPSWFSLATRKDAENW